jgi:hypothetical protein
VVLFLYEGGGLEQIRPSKKAVTGIRNIANCTLHVELHINAPGFRVVHNADAFGSRRPSASRWLRLPAPFAERRGALRSCVLGF